MRFRDREFAMPTPSVFTWDNTSPDAGPPRPMKEPPWWTNKSAPPGKEARPFNVALLELSQKLSGKAAIDVILAEGMKEPEQASRILAIRCLGAINDISKLVDALSNEKYRDVRLVAIGVLRHWLELRPDHDLKLFELLRDQKKYSEGQAAIVMHLMHDFAEDQIANPATYDTLIEYLRNDKLPIRELAYWQLSRLVPEGEKKIRYDPAGSEDQRLNSVRLWKQLIPEGKLPPRAPVGKQ